MSKIVYFNINYSCNSKCTFCFSNSTGMEQQELRIDEICDRLDSVELDQEDVIILNGGEPTLHSDFYRIVERLLHRYQSKIKVYTNGSILNVPRLKDSSKLSFVIPIHGDKAIHDEITRVTGLYEKTVENLKQLDKRNVDYEIKFIINNMMIRLCFDIKKFLDTNGLKPNRIVLARLNETDKSRINAVDIPNKEKIVEYIRSQKERIEGKYKIIFLDIPFCYLDSINETNLVIDDAPEFYFNDIRNNMIRRTYYKNVMIGNECSTCGFVDKCNILKKTYLTLALDNEIWRMEVE